MKIIFGLLLAVVAFAFVWAMAMYRQPKMTQDDRDREDWLFRKGGKDDDNN